MSKSEQQLSLGSYPRKGSNSSNCSSVSEPYKSTWLKATAGVSSKLLYQTSQTKLPPSRSEDTLLVGKYKQHQQQQQPPLVTRSSTNSTTTSPLMGIKLPAKVNSASESMQSVSSEECPTSVSRGKLAKPTASVAAIADKSNSSELSANEDFHSSQAPLPGILQVNASRCIFLMHPLRNFFF